jgi:hypothetical protein
VEWVKDSTMRVRLAILADEVGIKAADGKEKEKIRKYRGFRF